MLSLLLHFLDDQWVIRGLESNGLEALLQRLEDDEEGGDDEEEAEGAVDTSDTSDLSYAAGFKADGDFTQSGGDITINVTGASGRGIGVDGTFTSAESSTGTLTITNSGGSSISLSDYSNNSGPGGGGGPGH